MRPIPISVREVGENLELDLHQYKLIVFAEDQPEYIPLPALLIHYDDFGEAITKWQLTWRERLHMLFKGEFFFSQLTFNKPLQPIKPVCKLSEARRNEVPHAD